MFVLNASLNFDVYTASFNFRDKVKAIASLEIRQLWQKK